ncbi:hypothetical protein BJV78DRAFT_1155048 [Lactifluus subvellereus]|nr:hypothetical protein BJV78DRAFT_1155048 [Lactifluus subvellereus]
MYSGTSSREIVELQLINSALVPVAAHHKPIPAGNNVTRDRPRQATWGNVFPDGVLETLIGHLLPFPPVHVPRQNLTGATVNGRPVLTQRYECREGEKDSFVTEQDHLLEVAAIATPRKFLENDSHDRSHHIRLTRSGDGATYDQQEHRSLAILYYLIMNKIFGEQFPGTVPGVGEGDHPRRTRQLANQIAWAIFLYPAPHPPHRSETLLVELFDANWTIAILRELRVSMASWVLDDRGGLFLHATYGDVGCLAVRPDPTSTMKTYVSVGNIAPTPINGDATAESTASLGASSRCTRRERVKTTSAPRACGRPSISGILSPAPNLEKVVGRVVWVYRNTPLQLDMVFYPPAEPSGN